MTVFGQVKRVKPTVLFRSASATVVGGGTYWAGRAAARPHFVPNGQALLLPLFYLQLDFSSISYCHIRQHLGSEALQTPTSSWPLDGRGHSPQAAIHASHLKVYFQRCEPLGDPYRCG